MEPERFFFFLEGGGGGGLGFKGLWVDTVLCARLREFLM